MTVIEPNLARYFQVGGIGFALFERGPSSSGWSKNLSLNTTEWSKVRASLDADSKFAELSAKVPEMPKSLISSNMVLECDFCAKIYATSTSQTTLQPNSTDSPPVPIPGGCAKPLSPNDESAGGASSEPNVRKKDAAKRAESERGEKASSSKCSGGERRERGPAAAEKVRLDDVSLDSNDASAAVFECSDKVVDPLLWDCFKLLLHKQTQLFNAVWASTVNCVVNPLPNLLDW